MDGASFFLIITIIALVIVLIKYNKLMSNFNERVQMELSIWKDRELARERLKLMDEARSSLELWRSENESDIRRNAIDRSVSVITGRVAEHIAPYLGEFKYNPKDLRFLGTPVDFIVFDGLCEGVIKNVVFLEIKTNSSQLNSREKQVRDAIKMGKIAWDVFRIHTSQYCDK